MIARKFWSWAKSGVSSPLRGAVGVLSLRQAKSPQRAWKSSSCRRMCATTAGFDMSSVVPISQSGWAWASFDCGSTV